MQVLASLEKRIREDGEERERRKDFKITDASDAPNMRVIEQWPSDMKQP